MKAASELVAIQYLDIVKPSQLISESQSLYE